VCNVEFTQADAWQYTPVYQTSTWLLEDKGACETILIAMVGASAVCTHMILIAAANEAGRQGSELTQVGSGHRTARCQRVHMTL